MYSALVRRVNISTSLRLNTTHVLRRASHGLDFVLAVSRQQLPSTACAGSAHDRANGQIAVMATTEAAVPQPHSDEHKPRCPSGLYAVR